MNISDKLTNVGNHLKTNAPELLTAIGIGGVITTSYLSGIASYRARNVIKKEEDLTGTPLNKKERLKSRAKLVWKLYIPTGVSGAVTIGCILGATKSNNRRTAAAITAYSLSEKAFSAYKEKVIEEIGETKEQGIRDTLVQERIREDQPKQLIITGQGDTLCCELFTGRYFKSDIELIRRAENKVNALIYNRAYVTVSEFYDLLDIPHTSNSSNLGWDSDKMMELSFTSVLTDNGQPCLAFDYNYTKPL